MKPAQVVPLNYCAHAIEQLRADLPQWRERAPLTARVYERVITMLQDSVKFILPDRCELIDPTELRQAHLDLAHLPYPLVAFEAPWNVVDHVEQIGEFQQTPSTKRIALCWEAKPEYELVPGLYSILTEFPEGGIFVLPIYWVPAFDAWEIARGGAFVPYLNEVTDLNLADAPAVTRIANLAVIEAGLASNRSKQFRIEPFVALPEPFDGMMAQLGSREHAFAQIMLDSRDEVMMLVQACSVINCANITTAEVPASSILNKKRVQKGKQPFFTYKVLQLAEDRRAAGGGGAGGQHSSPRMHLRRGHLRRLETKVVWVRPAMVNAGSERGVVAKDYAVSSSK